MDRRRIFRFGESDGTPYVLEIRMSGDGRKVLRLSQGKDVSKGLSDQNLEMLQYLLERTGKDCLRDDILWAISPDSVDNLVDRYVSYLRAAFGDTDDHDRRFIGTVSHGYKFLLPVQIEGDLGSFETFAKWNKLRFEELMGGLRREPEVSEDVRIITTGLSPTLETLDIPFLLKRHLRIKILFMDPKDKALTNARYALRKDKPPSRCLRELEDQISDVKELMNGHGPAGRGKDNEHRGTIEYAVSDKMPCGFVIHTRRWALLGIFLAHTTYTNGPMFEIHAGTEAWDQLQADWTARWDDATT